MLRTRTRSLRGSAALEFAVSLPFLVTMSVGTFAVGVVIDRNLTVAQLVRHAGNMYGRGVDFSQTQNQDLLLQAATGMGMTATGGNGVIYLSLVVQARPNAAGENRPNADRAVVAHRIVIGAASISASTIASPFGVLPDGEVPNYDNDNITARATLPAGLTLTANERLYIAEVFHTPLDLSLPGFFAPRMLFSQAVF